MVTCLVVPLPATVSVEPEVFLREHHRGEVDPYYSKSDRPHPDFLITPMYFEDQLTTALAAERVHALNDAANLSPNGLDVSASDMSATVWRKYSAGVRALITSPK